MHSVKRQIIPIILCGGSGTRLWPVSRKSFPKQFVPLVDGMSLLELTLRRLSKFAEDVWCVTGEEHRFLVAEAQDAAKIRGTLILEPAAKNTAAAMALAAIHARSAGLSDALLLFCPADHHIPDTTAFVETIQHGIASAQSGAFVTFGVVPTFPSTAYGYIEKGDASPDGSSSVVRFIEKPNTQKAQDLILDGNALWNAGIFLVRADALLGFLSSYAADVLRVCESSMAASAQEKGSDEVVFVRPQAEIFNACRSESIDYAVLEKCPKVAVVPFNSQWSDVGSWNAVADLTPADTHGNRVWGKGSVRNAHNTYVHAPCRPVVALGTNNLLIIDTPDALLVADRSHAEQVKNVVSELEALNCVQAVSHRRVARPWGWYDSIDVGSNFQVKRIGVKPGASISLQKHLYRAEHWIVVKGEAKVVRGDEVFFLKENQSTYIPIGEVHRLTNPGDVELEIVEVQSGSYLGEDDIVRFDDTYGRVAN